VVDGEAGRARLRYDGNQNIHDALHFGVIVFVAFVNGNEGV